MSKKSKFSKTNTIFQTKNLLYLREKVKAFHFRCALNTTLLDFMLAKHHLSFSKFCDNFFYTQLAFVFHLLRDFYIVHNRIVKEKDLDTFPELSSNPFFLVIFSWWIFSHFYIWKKKFYTEKITLKNGSGFLWYYYYQYLHSLHNS